MADLTSFRARVLIGAFLTLWAGGCTRHSEKQAAAFPASNAVAGWVRSSPIRTFQAADLWKYIDGEAERYLQAGVRSVSTADYHFRDQFDAVVDIYIMESRSGVQKIVESEPAGGATAIQLGDGGRLFGQSMVFYEGPWLVRITAYEGSTGTPAALLALARGVEQRLGK